MLVRLKVLFELQLRHHTDAAFASVDTDEPHGLLSIPKCGFETTAYILHIGAELEPPGAAGRADYNLCRRLVLDAFLASFRSWCLHRKTLSYEQEDLLRRRAEDLSSKWNHVQALSGLEDLVLHRLLPPTLDEIQEREGLSALQHIACGRFSLSSYQADRVSLFQLAGGLEDWK